MRRFLFLLLLALSVFLSSCGEGESRCRSRSIIDLDADRGLSPGAERVLRNSSRPRAGNPVWEDYQRERDRNQRNNDLRLLDWPVDR